MEKKHKKTPEEKAAVVKQKKQQKRAKRKKEARDNLTKEEILQDDRCFFIAGSKSELISGAPSSFFQIIEFCPSFKSFSIAGRNISGDIDIQASFYGQMLWNFHFATIFSQTDTDIFFAIITSKRFHISEVFLLRCTEIGAFLGGFRIRLTAFFVEIPHS